MCKDLQNEKKIKTACFDKKHRKTFVKTKNLKFLKKIIFSAKKDTTAKKAVLTGA